jgi:hypothetical protein
MLITILSLLVYSQWKHPLILNLILTQNTLVSIMIKNSRVNVRVHYARKSIIFLDLEINCTL